jgi:hypothetical protein
MLMRQSVKIAFDVDDVSSIFGGALPGARTGSGSAAKSSFEMAFDFKFSKYGDPVPAITAPPTR